MQRGALMKKTILRIAIVLLILAAISFSLYKVMNARTFQLMGEFIPSVTTEEKVVALTFDDGPTEKTDQILKILDEEDIKATFFLVGSSIKENPEKARSIAAAGHDIGNHSYSHHRMIFKSPAFIQKEIESTDALIRQAGYQGEIYFRPPNGKKLVFLPYYLNKHDRKTIMWNIEPDSNQEAAGKSEMITELVNDQIQPGSIILLHVMYDNEKRESLESIKEIAKALRAKGYTFKTVSELLEYQTSKTK